jgi:hypothetical protein
MVTRRTFLQKSTHLAAGALAAGTVTASTSEAQAQQPQAPAKKLNILMRSSWGTKFWLTTQFRPAHYFAHLTDYGLGRLPPQAAFREDA